jgi:hypothetical protein
VCTTVGSVLRMTMFGTTHPQKICRFIFQSMQRTIGGSQTQTSVSSTATIPRTRSTIAALGKQNRIPTPTTQQPDHRPNYPPVGSRRPRRREWRDLEHLLVDSDVRVRLEVGDVVVGARRRRGVRLRRLSQRVPRG